MSVVEIKKRFVSDEQKFQDAALSDKSFLHLQGGLPPEHFSVELSVGGSWSERYGPRSTQMFRIPEEGLDIGRHGSIVIEVAERLMVPHNMYGIVVPTGSLFLDRGILIAPAKVEPSYSGTLKLRLFNTTSYKHRLKSGAKVASIVFFSTENTSFQPSVTKASIDVNKPVPRAKRLLGWASRNRIQVINWILMVACSSVAAAVLVHYAFANSQSPKQGAAQTIENGTPSSTPTDHRNGKR